MKHPEETLNRIRTCLHSDVQIPSDPNAVDYRCQVRIPHSRPNELGPTCKLLKFGKCDEHEPFPECNNH